ncbi:hypothetical protein LOC71_00710 [Rhodopirellula sp. JC740]|uniref:Glycosyltransferase RgtA/B/C/D-like domain-containing protein n=1 Tax=Rhodopirellula halodulae TaxID=2894198 RepID=A0ABS8NB48_9BACT|nr:hypothetical protein [Rhodopirellula sp. JC740]MCC9640778.1 hypothetical protein [Rhodopirellula sp. JC740]
MRPFLLTFLAAFFILMGTCWATNRFAPHLVPDSPSYTEYSFESARTVASQIRTPGYPALHRLARIAGEGHANQTMVLIHIALQAMAVTLLACELRAWGATRTATIIAAASLAIGCTFWDHVNTIATDAPAMSLAVVVGVLLLRTYRVASDGKWMALIGTIAAVVIFIRPAYLVLIPWSFLIVLCRPPSLVSRRFVEASMVAVVPVVLVLAWCGFRFAAVSDFGFLPFGHQNMAAVTTQLLDADELESLPGDLGTLGANVAARRVEMAAADREYSDGLDLRPVPNAEQRADSYTTIENRWDAMTYMVVIPAAAELEPDSVRQHQLLARMDQTIVTQYPTRYAKWFALAVRRGVWGSVADMIMHPIFFGGALLGIASLCWGCWRLLSQPSEATLDTRMNAGRWRLLATLTVITLSYWLSNIAFVALTSPPIGRFSNAAAVWIPVLLTVVVAEGYASFSISLSNASSSSGDKSDASMSE